MLHRLMCKDNATCKGPKQSSEHPPHRKIDVTSKPPVGGISVVTLIRTDTTLDHSQKAEKVCPNACRSLFCLFKLFSKFTCAFWCAAHRDDIVGASAAEWAAQADGERCKGTGPCKNLVRHIDVSHSRQPLVKGERLMRTERKTATVAGHSEHQSHVKSSTLCRPFGHTQKQKIAGNTLSTAWSISHLRGMLGLSPPKNCKNDLDDQT